MNERVVNGLNLMSWYFSDEVLCSRSLGWFEPADSRSSSDAVCGTKQVFSKWVE